MEAPTLMTVPTNVAEPKSILIRPEPPAVVPSDEGVPIVQVVVPIFQYPNVPVVAVVPMVPVNVWLIVRLLSVTLDMSAAPIEASANPAIAWIYTSSPLPARCRCSIRLRPVRAQCRIGGGNELDQK